MHLWAALLDMAGKQGLQATEALRGRRVTRVRQVLLARAAAAALAGRVVLLGRAASWKRAVPRGRRGQGASGREESNWEGRRDSATRAMAAMAAAPWTRVPDNPTESTAAVRRSCPSAPRTTSTPARAASRRTSRRARAAAQQCPPAKTTTARRHRACGTPAGAPIRASAAPRIAPRVFAVWVKGRPPTVSTVRAARTAAAERAKATCVSPPTDPLRAAEPAVPDCASSRCSRAGSAATIARPHPPEALPCA
jgi:hypothetical protein